MNNPNLDDPQLFSQYDPDNMLSNLSEVPQLCQRAWQRAIDFNLPPNYCQIDRMIIFGMGASAIGGTLAGSLVRDEASIPVIVYGNYRLPAMVNDNTLVIFSSYSGNTEEILSLFRQATNTRAKKLVMTNGGQLEAMAESENIPTFKFNYRGQVRATLPFSFIPILCFLQRLGFITDKSRDISEMIPTLEQLLTRIDATVPSSANLAKQLATQLHNHLPVIYGGGLAAEVAHRWKTQFNENSKAWAFYEVFPELNHNAIVGYQFPPELASKIIVIMLQPTQLPRRIQLRYQITRQLLEQAEVAYQTVAGIGNSPLGQMMSLILFGDYVSYYLAMLHQIDPSPVKNIEFLKQQLAQHQEE
ncbi:MAG: bifunctional phosphoglucose/phosphomannose isomerase [Dehalococcoidales bacterium]|nr:bifunctional phosphoglucose/phosphomannose isomerase [Dehalococcoidales bacterium]